MNRADTIKIVLAIILVLFVYKKLKAWGLFGPSVEELDFSSSSKFLPFRILWGSQSMQDEVKKLSQQKRNEFTAEMSLNAGEGKYENMTRRILRARGFLNDNEGNVFEIFNEINSLQELAFFRETFKNYVKNNPVEVALLTSSINSDSQNLGVFLYSFLNGSDYPELKRILSKLNNYV